MILELSSEENFLSPYNRILVILSSFKKLIFRSMLVISFMRPLHIWVKLGQRRKKWETDSSSVLQEHIGFNVSKKPWVNLCLFRWLKPSLKRVRSLIPSSLVTSNILFWIGLIIFKSLLLKWFTDTEFWIVLSSLGKKLFLKDSVRQKIEGILDWVQVLKGLLGFGINS